MNLSVDELSCSNREQWQDISTAKFITSCCISIFSLCTSDLFVTSTDEDLGRKVLLLFPILLCESSLTLKLIHQVVHIVLYHLRTYCSCIYNVSVKHPVSNTVVVPICKCVMCVGTLCVTFSVCEL